jgi:deferrochelatase/peroxidase EfeB
VRSHGRHRPPELAPGPAPTRRRFLTGAAALGAAGAGAAALAACSPSSEAGTAGPTGTTASGAGASATLTAATIPFDGAHQAGIATPGQAFAIVAAFDVVSADRGELQGLFRTISETARALTQDHAVGASTTSAFPPADNGVLGAEPAPDNLTITVGVGASLFDGRYGLADRKPVKLTAMPRFHNDELDPARLHGDLVVQICADHEDSCLRALRILAKETRGAMAVRWMQDGFQRPNELTGPRRTSTRNMLGFKDGTANPEAGDDALMDQLVWVQPGAGEPAWATGGSYLVVRMIRMLVERWDRTSLAEQEAIIGRDKTTGAPLGQPDEADIPAYATDTSSTAVPVDAHIRLARPHTAATEDQRILRRGFSFSNGFDAAGQLDQGLLFIAYQQDVERGFATIQKRLDREPLEEYIKPVGGGYFFALPGASPTGELGEGLFA